MGGKHATSGASSSQVGPGSGGGGPPPTVSLKNNASTGTTSLGSTSLPLAAGGGALFNIGDPIVVSATSFVRNTDGPGGNNPASTPSDPNEYYTEVKQPKGLKTTIANKSGDTLTLAVPAQSAGAVAIRYDNHNILQSMTGDNILPAGDFYISPGIGFDGPSYNNMQITGQGKNVTRLIIPIGFAMEGMAFSSLSGVGVRGFSLIGNMVETGGVVNSVGVGPYGYGINFAICNGCTLEDVHFKDFFMMCFRLQYGGGRMIFRRIDVERTCPDQRYLQWQWDIVDTSGKFAPSDEYGTLIEDVTFTCPYLCKAGEGFSAADVLQRRTVTHNAIQSLNTVQRYIVENHTATFSAGCRRTDMRIPIDAAECDAFQISGNIGGSDPTRTPGSGISLGLDHVDAAGALSGTIGAGTATILGLATINNTADVLVHGTYDTTVADDGVRKGWVRGPWDITVPRGPYGLRIRCDGSARVKLDGVRVFNHHVATNTDKDPAINNFEVLDSEQKLEVALKTAINASFTGIVNVAAWEVVNPSFYLFKFALDGTATIGSEIISYTFLDNTGALTGRITITGRGLFGSTAASHAVDARVKYRDESFVTNSVMDGPFSIDAPGRGDDGLPTVEASVLTNAEYEALTSTGILAITDDLGASNTLTITNDLGVVNTINMVIV